MAEFTIDLGSGRRIPLVDVTSLSNRRIKVVQAVTGMTIARIAIVLDRRPPRGSEESEEAYGERMLEHVLGDEFREAFLAQVWASRLAAGDELGFEEAVEDVPIVDTILDFLAQRATESQAESDPTQAASSQAAGPPRPVKSSTESASKITSTSA